MACLRLPPTNPGQSLLDVRMHSGPFVARLTPGVPFSTAQDTRIHILTLFYQDHQTACTLFVHNRHLLSYITPRVGADPPLVTVKQWEEWGPDNTRVINFANNFRNMG